MKYTVLTLALLAAISASTVAKADDQTVTLGYAQSKMQDFKNIRGVNLKYRYEWNSPVSVITSFTYMSGSKDSSYLATRDIVEQHAEVKYYSLAAGPAYRFNAFVSVYGLVGLNHSKIDYNWKNYEGGRYEDMGGTSGSNNSTNFTYGAGVQINPWENITVDVGYRF